jgi:hypothetical protein
MQQSALTRLALSEIVPGERSRPELSDVRLSERKQECAAGTRHDRRGAQLHGTQ